MPCEPVTTPAGVPIPSSPRPPTSSANTTSSLAFRMKRAGSSGGARRALTALGTNDTDLNVRLARSLLTISQDKFAKKWNFDPVNEVPLPQGRFSWTPTTFLSLTTASPSSSSCLLLGTVPCCSGSSSSSSIGSSSHDLGAGAEAEDNAAALRTCLNLPHTDTITATAPGHPPAPAAAAAHEPRVPPIHPEEPPCILVTTAPKYPNSTTVPSSNKSSNSSSSSSGKSVMLVGKVNIGPSATDSPTNAASKHITTLLTTTCISSSSSSSSGSTSVGRSDDSAAASIATGPRAAVAAAVDNEGSAAEALQDNQCQEIDPTSPSSTDTRMQHATSPLTQTCITNYLRPRKRSSAHLQEGVHPPKAKKVLLAA